MFQRSGDRTYKSFKAKNTLISLWYPFAIILGTQWYFSLNTFILGQLGYSPPYKNVESLNCSCLEAYTKTEWMMPPPWILCDIFSLCVTPSTTGNMWMITLIIKYTRSHRDDIFIKRHKFPRHCVSTNWLENYPI